MSTAQMEVRLLSRAVCDDLATVRFERPADYEFVPGQWLRLTLETADGPETKTFSIASAPHDDYLEVTTRLSGSLFKDALAALPIGDPVPISPAAGRFRLPDVRRLAFLIGGVGITPVRSMLRAERHAGHTLADAVLFYGNEAERCVPYLQELLEMADTGLYVVLAYEQPGEGWEGETGFITAEMVRRHAEPIDDRAFVAAGPPVMVTAMERVLDELGVPEELRVVERFAAPVKRPSV